MECVGHVTSHLVHYNNTMLCACIICQCARTHTHTNQSMWPVEANRRGKHKEGQADQHAAPHTVSCSLVNLGEGEGRRGGGDGGEGRGGGGQ